MSAAPPLLLNLQGARRRLLYVTLFEGLAIAIVTLALLVFTGAGAASAGGLAIGSSAIALGWNLMFNMLFERWERRQPTRGRSAARRVAHAIGFEGGLLLFLVPFFAWWLGVSLWQALVLDIGFLLFFLVYNFVFAWAFDRLFVWSFPAGWETRKKPGPVRPFFLKRRRRTLKSNVSGPSPPLTGSWKKSAWTVNPTPFSTGSWISERSTAWSRTTRPWWW